MIGELLPYAQLSATAALVVVLVYIIRTISSGGWVPRATVDSLLAARDAEIERSNNRGDEWQKAFEGERHVTDLVREQNRELIEVARTVGQVMAALGAVAESRTDASS